MEISDWPLPEDYTPETIAGREAFVSGWHDEVSDHCEVVTAHVEKQPGTRETASVYVIADLDDADPCESAKAIAAIVFPQLPKAP
ncbi:hypothetical protein [Actinokineospora iranica]|uniref:Uncharacterized protein n=1 Tax=Actinokineospora iranica TaxID=1271860 RepID=A0A1G6JWY9_9PSEU|nr:hypothetical protein [Actinokineospora iranica]SDC23141.1 hypothetical protein SAMN05216174_101598 [Actinokineospora iranica]